ncbi:hypothetical protein C4D60_Mb04t15610 [Musa balbisiana]|uniref:Uncharacterized protein n=1 Tax=Musa balbisiana TaxID=52838 RepID=A0A4S8KC88_MUSBA|nr:hypothetical protein C4D60_Mb04t15610 [Musa balbisiana]
MRRASGSAPLWNRGGDFCPSVASLLPSQGTEEKISAHRRREEADGDKFRHLVFSAEGNGKISVLSRKESVSRKGETVSAPPPFPCSASSSSHRGKGAPWLILSSGDEAATSEKSLVCSDWWLLLPAIGAIHRWTTVAASLG